MPITYDSMVYVNFHYCSFTRPSVISMFRPCSQSQVIEYIKINAEAALSKTYILQ